MGAPVYQRFERAAAQYAAQPNSGESIAEMMELACDSRHPAFRSWAARWLRETCNISVVTDTKQGQAHATPATATSILR